MAKHANKPTRSTHKAQQQRQKTKCSNKTPRPPVPDHFHKVELSLLNPFGIDIDVATTLATAIATDDQRLLTMCVELMSRQGVNLFALRWNCRVTGPGASPAFSIVNACELAQSCGSKRALTFLIAIAMNKDRDEAYDALSRLATAFGDGRGTSAEVVLAREVFAALFKPTTVLQARDQLHALELDPGLGPHVAAFLTNVCLSFLAREEEGDLRMAIDAFQSSPQAASKQARL